MTGRMDQGDGGRERRRRLTDRRADKDRRAGRQRPSHGSHEATWGEQRSQCMVRYLFWFLGLVYFNLRDQSTTAWLHLPAINVVLVLYGTVITITLLHARYFPQSYWRRRLAMWSDIAAASFAVLADPVDFSPGYLVYLVVILGNGMRYGQRFFAEALLASFLAATLTSVLRFSGYQNPVDSGVAFFLLFGGIVMVYAYYLSAGMEKLRKRLEHASNIDMLTGLLNRRGLYKKAEELFKTVEQSKGQLAVLFADLDKFKIINDELGHHAGDRVLAEIASALAECVRDTDVIGRYGGDEFVLLLPETQLDMATGVAERIHSELALWSRGAGLDLSASIGIGAAPTHGNDFRSVLAQVDRAMYQCKAVSGGGGIHCLDAKAGTGNVEAGPNQTGIN